MTTYGYARTSTVEQVAGLADQIAKLKSAGCSDQAAPTRALTATRRLPPILATRAGVSGSSCAPGASIGPPAIPRFAMMKQALQHMKRILNLGAHAGLGLFQLLLQSARAILLERLAQSLHGKPARFEPQFRSPFTFSQWRTGLLA
jgi:hypothetical protein